jgi:tRNA pseudouridine13 synthase
VPAGRQPADWFACAGEGFRVLAVHPHARKLRRGALAGNRFRIVVREFAGDAAALGLRLATLAAQGAPNYFGPQRFGRQGANLEDVAAWSAGEPLPRERERRAFVISAARALLFNQALAARVAAGDWDRLLPGEVVNLAGSASVFVANDVDAALAARCRALDLHPTGPLPGRGGMRPSGRAAEAESSALAAFGPLVEALAAAGVEAARRPLRVPPAGLDWRLDGTVLELSFSLPRGAYATALLRELIDAPADDLPQSDD